ncbi:MAG TPA: S-adenosylmethionine decarboxylase [Thermoanaerobaculia bacterium]|nr:S-adenosylmethionine decarboxylase [Thermoanaerobaculia bacterium]
MSDAMAAHQGSDDPWGYQLIIDCFGCDEEACCDLDRGYEFLDKICVFLKMTKQTQPYIFKTCESTFPGRPGYSGWVPIIESGIQVHTSAKNRFISVDVYSCKKFDPLQVEEFVRQWFQPRVVETVLLNRGSDLLNRSFGHQAVEAGA